MLRSNAARVLLLLFLVTTLVACSAALPGSTTVRGGPVTLANFAENTSEETRAAHRDAVAHLRGSRFAEACDVLDGVPLSERRRLTDYLAVLCATRLPDRALHAETEAARVANIDQAPALTGAQVGVLNRHRAWIAGIQDRFAAVAQSSLGLPNLPVPQGVSGPALILWSNRGDRFDRDTYLRTRESDELRSLATQLRLNEIVADLVPFTAHQVLFVDTTGMTLPVPPPMLLPGDGEL